MKKDLLKTLTGKYGEGKSFVVSVEWVKENDPEIYEQLLSMAENRVLCNDWLVEYTFNDIDGNEEIEIVVTVGTDRGMLNNQPAWIHEVLPLDVFIDFYEYEKYIAQLK